MTPCLYLPNRPHRSGYVRVRVGHGQKASAHRVAYERVHGPIPAGMEIDHICFHRACVNPEHLEAVTTGENNRRAAARPGSLMGNRSKQQCPAGHPYDAANTAITPTKGGGLGRKCRPCHAKHERDRRARLKAEGRPIARQRYVPA